jgi:hypothetical protein
LRVRAAIPAESADAQGGPTVTIVHVFLTDPDHPRAYREVQSEADAIWRTKTAKVVTFTLPAETETRTYPAQLEAIFAITNGVTDGSEAQAAAAAEYRHDAETRSLSVGDLVHLPGYGLYSVQSVGWRRHDHRLTWQAAQQAAQRHYAQVQE